MNDYELTKFNPQQRVKKGVYIKCETCGSDFYIPPSRIAQAEKNNCQIRYCSMKCYVKTGDKNPFHGKKHSNDSIRKMTSHDNRSRFGYGKDNPNFSRFGEDFFPASGWNVRKRLIHDKLLTIKCEICGFNAEPKILHLHHKDRDRNNNSRENLQILCPNCHYTVHLRAKDGWFKYAKNYT